MNFLSVIQRTDRNKRVIPAKAGIHYSVPQEDPGFRRDGAYFLSGRFRRTALTLLVATALAACSMAPEYERPRTGAAQGWSGPQDAGTNVAADTQWWAAFGDPELTLLMQTALGSNLTIAQALARVEQARGAARSAGANLLPQLSGSGGASTRSIDGGSGRESANIGLSASYALDLWGRYRDEARSSAFTLQATEYDKDAAALLVQSQVATTYFSILALKDQIAISEESLAAARSTLEIVEARYKAGSISGLDLAQQRNAIAVIEAGLPALRASLSENQNALAILLGRTPGNFTVEAQTLDRVTLPAITAGQPSALLERRPDIRSAEARLQAANANIGAARAAFFPSLDLTASLTRSFATANPAETASALGASLLAPIFSGGTLEGNLQSATARQAELAATYQQTVLTSFGEVENALVDTEATAERERLLAVAAQEARRAYDLAEARYRSGASDLLSVLDAQRSWLSTRNNLAQARLDRYSTAVSLFVALGGGWQSS